MAKATVSLAPDDLTTDMMAYIRSLFRQAYEQGVQDGRDRYDLPALLTRKHLAHELQASLPTVDRIASLPGFTKSTLIKGRFPRDPFFHFLDEHQEIVGKIKLRSIY
jgi:hypothetical protein